MRFAAALQTAIQAELSVKSMHVVHVEVTALHEAIWSLCCTGATTLFVNRFALLVSTTLLVNLLHTAPAGQPPYIMYDIVQRNCMYFLRVLQDAAGVVRL